AGAARRHREAGAPGARRPFGSHDRGSAGRTIPRGRLAARAIARPRGAGPKAGAVPDGQVPVVLGPETRTRAGEDHRGELRAATGGRTGEGRGGGGVGAPPNRRFGGAPTQLTTRWRPGGSPIRSHADHILS